MMTLHMYVISENVCVRKCLKGEWKKVELVKWVHILVDKCKRRRKFHCLVHRIKKKKKSINEKISD